MAPSSTETSDAPPISSPPTGTSGADLDATAVGFLEAVRAGDDRAVELASKLADLVLDAAGARLAFAVLEGGPLTITRAIRLAEHVLHSVTVTGGLTTVAGVGS